MSKDIIYREDAIKAIHSYWKDELNKMPTTDSEYGEVIDGDYSTLLKHNKELSIRIKDIPSADRPKGEWIDRGWKGDWQFETDGRGNCWYEYECSECGYIKRGGKSNYCPDCGTDMRKREDE